MPRFRLVCESGEAPGAELGAEPVAIGRHPDNDIVIKDDLASRFHCVVEPNGKGFRVRDLGSRNGTRVNEEAVEDAPLRPGDMVQVGSHMFRLDADGRFGKSSKQKASPEEAVENRWVADLVKVIETLPPKHISATQQITLYDARGDASDALEGNSPGPAAIRLLLIAASKARATDLHVEPKADGVNVRMRVDGVMVSMVKLPSQVGENAMGLIRNACHLKAAGREAVLEGHFSLHFPDRRVDYRASFTPSIHGQKLVLRVLDLRDTPHDLKDMGMPGYMLKRVEGVLQQDTGMILACGPTGSGKTTTLYNCMRNIDTDRRNVITIEDPVEYQVSGITQIPIDEQQGNNFNNLLRSVLRQDPDVILVGEIRDDETASTAMRAAMTGHLVFTTLHARDTIGSVFRLLDLGVEPYLVSNSLNLVIAQRLVRILCEHCKRPTQITPSQATQMGRFAGGVKEVYTATGCSKCLRTGYRGREAIFEMLDFNDELRDLVLNKPSIQGMKRVIDQGLFTTLTQSGWQLVAKGVTSLEEIERVTGNM